MRLQRWPQALADYDRAEQIGSLTRVETYFLHAGRGYVALVGRADALAVAELDLALAIDPDAVNVLMWRDYERAAKFQPDEVSVGTSLQRMRTAVREMPARQEPRLLRR